MTFDDVAELKKRFVESKEFHDFHDYFLTNFVESGNFMDLGRVLNEKRAVSMDTTLAEAYANLTGVTMATIISRLVELPEFGIIHGALTINGKIASVLYFEDISMGMFVVVENNKTGETKFIRFTMSGRSKAKPS